MPLHNDVSRDFARRKDGVHAEITMKDGTIHKDFYIHPHSGYQFLIPKDEYLMPDPQKPLVAIYDIESYRLTRP
jgi:hypothetical protein